MKVGLLAVDSRYPNLALMKLSAWHRVQGDTAEWYSPFSRYDRVYMAKVFTFTPDYPYYVYADETVKGGTGYDIRKTLPEEADRTQPDYSLYPQIDGKTAYGFLTRGCPNRCKWCCVPEKEGKTRPYMDADEIAAGGRTNLILMDNNVLASDYGLAQLEKIVRRGYRADFNQGLDARLVTPEIAGLLARVKWMKRIRFGCDTPGQIEECERAVSLIRSHGYRGEFFLYCIILGFRESVERISFWKRDKGVVVHAQPYRDLHDPRQTIPQWQKDLAHWADRKELYRSCGFRDFEPRKGFRCEEYFKRYTE